MSGRYDHGSVSDFVMKLFNGSVESLRSTPDKSRYRTSGTGDASKQGKKNPEHQGKSFTYDDSLSARRGVSGAKKPELRTES
jgi:hypothetical protein